MKKLTPGVGLRHLARFCEYVRVLSLTSAYLLLLVLAAPAWSAEKVSANGWVGIDQGALVSTRPDGLCHIANGSKADID